MSISSVTSEALQLKLRQLLPSQQGFGTDLSASDTIIPIIDLTASAEGSDVRPDLQLALAFGSITANAIYNTTSTIINTTGFYRMFGNCSVGGNGGTAGSANISITDGSTSKIMRSWFSVSHATGQDTTQQEPFDIIVYLNAGESVTATSNAQASLNIATRQVADTNGTLVQPSGFTPQ